MLATVVELDYDYKVRMPDVQTSFFNADVEEEVFVKMAHSYETTNKVEVPLVMKLKISLYGLRQSPKN